MARENRASGPPSPIFTAAMSGSNAPTQNATQTTCTNTEGRVSSCGAALLACPLSASAKPATINAANDSRRATTGASRHAASNANNAANNATIAAITVRP